MTAGVPAREIAILVRVNADTERFELALAEACLPYVIRGAERFYDRPVVRQALVLLRDGKRIYHFCTQSLHGWDYASDVMRYSDDSGATWSKPIAPPKALKGVGGLTWLDYDPTRDVLYLMKMGSDLFRLPAPRGGD